MTWLAEVFCAPPPIESFNKLSRESQKYCDYLMDVGSRVTFVAQDVQEGFGHAVYCARQWVGDEPFLLLLGDAVRGTLFVIAARIGGSLFHQVAQIILDDGNAFVEFGERRAGV